MLAAFAAGCTLGPDFQPPAVQAPGAWKARAGAAPGAAEPLPERWWTLFRDEELAQLVERALLHNEDLQAGFARVEQARAFAAIARAAQLPFVSIDPSIERERFSANRSAPPGTARGAYTTTTYELPLDVSYEVDLWGRLRRAREAAEAAAQASAHDQAALSLAISSEVARTWISVRSARREEEVLREGAELRQRVLDIAEGRSRAGIGNDLDTSRARTELATVQAGQHGVARARAALENALAVLCGEAPADFTTASSGPRAPGAGDVPAGPRIADGAVDQTAMRRPVTGAGSADGAGAAGGADIGAGADAAARAGPAAGPEVTASPDEPLVTLPAVPAGLPSELLQRRPDIAAAIERLHEASAEIGVAQAEAWPRLSLTGAAGFVSTELSHLFDAGSRAWLLGAAGSAPVYAGGAFDARILAARAACDERAADYRGTLLVAFREVEDALSALAELDAEIGLQGQAHADARRTFELADARYRQGLVGFLDVVDAARAELDARRAIVQLQGLRAESTVLLIQALGGGWSAESQAAAQAPVADAACPLPARG